MFPHTTGPILANRDFVRPHFDNICNNQLKSYIQGCIDSLPNLQENDFLFNEYRRHIVNFNLGKYVKPTSNKLKIEEIIPSDKNKSKKNVTFSTTIYIREINNYIENIDEMFYDKMGRRDPILMCLLLDVSRKEMKSVRRTF